MLFKLAVFLTIFVPLVLSDASPDAAASPQKPVAKLPYNPQYNLPPQFNAPEREYDRGNDFYRRDGGFDNAPDFYGHHQPQRFPDQFSFDTHYCSVHASFALVLPKDNAQAPASNDYQNSGYGRDAPRRFFARQFCRYAATNSDDACKFCCRVAARSANTSPDDIVAAIFAFDPANPTGNGAGYQGDDDSLGDGPYRKKRDAAGTPIAQCVCCAPKRDF